MRAKLSEDQIGFQRHGYKLNAEINVTPFVDVMLVLLVIFMIAAPLATVTVPVVLPQSTATPTPTPITPVTVTVQTDGSIFVGNVKTDGRGLVGVLLMTTKQSPGTRVVLRGDTHLQYGQLMQVMGELANGGFTTIGLVSQETEKP